MSHSHAMQCATHLWRLALVLLEKFALPVPKKLLHLVQLVHAGQNVYVYIYKRRGCATAKRQMKRSRTKDATASRTTTLNRPSGACSIRCSRSDDALCLAGWRRKLIDIMHAPSAACTVHAAGRMLALARCCCCCCCDCRAATADAATVMRRCTSLSHSQWLVCTWPAVYDWSRTVSVYLFPFNASSVTKTKKNVS